MNAVDANIFVASTAHQLVIWLFRWGLGGLRECVLDFFVSWKREIVNFFAWLREFFLCEH